jgi:hypothetical protein
VGKLDKQVVVDLKSLEIQLEQSTLAKSNKALQVKSILLTLNPSKWSTCNIGMPFSALKSVFLGIADYINPNNIDAMLVTQSVLETLRTISQSVGDPGTLSLFFS